MSLMTSYRLADINLNTKIQEILVGNGIVSNKYRVIDGYPNEIDLKQNQIWPLISIEVDNLFGRDIEIGSKQWPACQFAIDVFANTDSQRDDITYMLFDGLNENLFRFYDFNTGFPPTIGNYAGISSTGDWYVDSLSTVNLYPEPNEITEGEKHHCLIDGLLYFR